MCPKATVKGKDIVVVVGRRIKKGMVVAFD